jgi:glycyl-tRNA synthetase beta chain
MAEFLLEIGLEEVPARMLAAAQAELGERLTALLKRERIAGDQTRVTTYSTPRRLAVLASELAVSQPDMQEQLTGPACSIAFKNGEPTPAAHAFAKKAGVAVEALQPLSTPKGEYCSAVVVRKGRLTTKVLAEFVPVEIAALSWPKPMYWRAGKPERFVRPLQWIVALLDSAIVPVTFAGVSAGRHTQGHRVLHGAAPVALDTPQSYVSALHAAGVVVDVEQRRHIIRKALDHATRVVAGARWREDEALVDSVTHLTEWPSVILGSFATEYLALPEEVLVTVMRDHQKYFALEDAAGKLAPHFLAVLNTSVDARGEAIIRHGNERVLRARFNDAQFFWDFDQKTPMADRKSLLAKVTFQKELGNYSEKTQRTLSIAQRLAALVLARGVSIDTAALEEAVELAKADLTTELVKEFTELQGIVGGLYVRHESGRPSEHAAKVADAIYWHYMPASIGDAIPSTVEGQLLGLADRIGTIVDMFSIGLVPSGSKDPYALRRAANAVIKILAESRLPIHLTDLLHASDASATATELVAVFLQERLSYYLREVNGLSADVVSAVLKAETEMDVVDVQGRAQALAQIAGSADMAAIAAAWKRTRNILQQAREKQLLSNEDVQEELLVEQSEKALWSAYSSLMPKVDALRKQKKYAEALEAIATLRPEVDDFFEKTMVMAEDAAVRANRLALLQSIVQSLGTIADFSELTAPSPAPGDERAEARP